MLPALALSLAGPSAAYVPALLPCEGRVADGHPLQEWMTDAQRSPAGDTTVRGRFVPPVGLSGFLVLPVVLFAVAYAVGTAAGPVAPGLHPGFPRGGPGPPPPGRPARRIRPRRTRRG